MATWWTRRNGQDETDERASHMCLPRAVTKSRSQEVACLPSDPSMAGDGQRTLFLPWLCVPSQALRATASRLPSHNRPPPLVTDPIGALATWLLPRLNNAAPDVESIVQAAVNHRPPVAAGWRSPGGMMLQFHRTLTPARPGLHVTSSRFFPLYSSGS